MESGDEDDAFTMGEREWQKMNRDLSKQGYRDGKNEGREESRQKSFEVATSLALKHSLKLGQVLGIIDWKLNLPSKMKVTQQQREKLVTIRNEMLSQLANLKDLPVPEDSHEKIREKTWNQAFSKSCQELLSTLQYNTTDQTDGNIGDQVSLESEIAKMLKENI